MHTKLQNLVPIVLQPAKRLFCRHTILVHSTQYFLRGGFYIN